MKEQLRARHYLRYMDDFLLVLGSRDEARARLAQVEGFLAERLHLALNPRRVVLAPLAVARDVLGYVVFPDGRVRVRRRSARRLWRRLAALEAGVAAGRVAWPAARASVASWFGLAGHAHALRLGRAIFTARDVRNVGKRLLVTALARRGPWTMRPPPAAAAAWPCSRAGGG